MHKTQKEIARNTCRLAAFGCRRISFPNIHAVPPEILSSPKTQNNSNSNEKTTSQEQQYKYNTIGRK